jgi:hypothetical protein
MRVNTRYVRTSYPLRAVFTGRRAVALLAALTMAALVPALPLITRATAEAQASELSVVLVAEDRQITVGDPLVLTISAVLPDGYHVIFPRLPHQWGSFEVRSQTPQATIINADLTRTAKQVLEVVLFAPGDHQTPELSVSFRGPDGEIVERSVRPATVHVTSVLEPGDQELRDIKSQADISVPSLWPWTLGAATLGLIGIAAFALWWRRSTLGPLAPAWVDPRTPFEIAMDQLDHIEQLDLPSEGRFKEHYVLVTDAVRGYLYQEFNVTSPDRTTTETQSALSTSAVPTSERREIVEVLRDGDLVKFSEVVPERDPSWEVVHRTRALIKAIRPPEPEPETVEPGASEGP